MVWFIFGGDIVSCILIYHIQARVMLKGLSFAQVLWLYGTRFTISQDSGRRENLKDPRHEDLSNSLKASLFFTTASRIGICSDIKSWLWDIENVFVFLIDLLGVKRY